MRSRNEAVRRSLPSDPPLLSALFTNPVFSVIWLVVRVYVGWQWLGSGLGKIQNTAWTVTGTALEKYWQTAVAIPATGKPPITYDWYRAFLGGLLEGGHYTWFAKLIAFGELAIGIALIIGAFVGVAAFFGAFMNLNFMLAGSASTNPVLFTLAILLILAWKIAGHLGFDHWLLPTVRTPWEWGIKWLFPRTSPQTT
ncbi:MAG: DoxX family membrane protein [Chloroflexi bacterium]|nr:DoxX family membrane protein [Chloroflexota bacterium]